MPKQVTYLDLMENWKTWRKKFDTNLNASEFLKNPDDESLQIATLFKILETLEKINKKLKNVKTLENSEKILERQK